MKIVLVFLTIVAVATSQSLNPPSNSWGYKSLGSDWSSTCQSGKSQSPVDFDGTTVSHSGNDTVLGLKLHYHPLAPVCGKNITVAHNGNAVVLEGDFGHVVSGTCCSRAKYYAKRLVFHAPSEHTIDGKQYSLEVQIEHHKKGSTGANATLIVSVLFGEKGTPGDTPFLNRIDWDELPQSGNQHNVKHCVDLNLLGNILHGDYFAYTGSLTTPGCDEGVEWRVMAGVTGISLPQIDAINTLFAGNSNFAGGNGNNRKVQNLNGRTVYYVSRQREEEKRKKEQEEQQHHHQHHKPYEFVWE